jgi:hypothetical protein
MPVSKLQAADQVTVSSNTGGATLGAGTTAGSTMVIVIVSSSAARTYTIPGFTQDLQFDGSSRRIVFFSKLNESAGVTAYTATVGGSLTSTFSTTVYEIAGGDAATVWDVLPVGQTEAAGTSHNVFASPGIDIGADELLIAAASADLTANWGTLTYSSVTIDGSATVSSASRFTASWAPGSLQSSYRGAYSHTTSRAVLSVGGVLKAAAGGGGGSSAGQLLLLGCGA